MPMRCLIKTFKIIYYIYIYNNRNKKTHTIIHIYILFYTKKWQNKNCLLALFLYKGKKSVFFAFFFK